MRAQNLKRGVHVREEGRQVGTEAAILEIVESRYAPTGGDTLEELRRGLVGVDAGRGEQADQAIGFHQAQGAFHEERVEIDVAAAQQGKVAGGAHQAAQAIGAGLGGVELRRKGIALGAQFLDGAAARRRGGRAGEVRRAGGEPLDLLQLDAVPRRIADDGVEATLWFGSPATCPRRRERRLPSGEMSPGRRWFWRAARGW